VSGSVTEGRPLAQRYEVISERTEALNPCTAKTPIFHDIAHFAHCTLRIRTLHLDFEIFK
jgi:hypothetical protein